MKSSAPQIESCFVLYEQFPPHIDESVLQPQPALCYMKWEGN